MCLFKLQFKLSCVFYIFFKGRGGGGVRKEKEKSNKHITYMENCNVRFDVDH